MGKSNAQQLRASVGFGSPRPFKRKRPLPDGYEFGRPTLYRPEYCDLAIEVMGQGYDVTAVAGSIGVAQKTVYRWIEEYPDFCHAIEIGKARRLLALQNKLLTTAMGVGVTAAIFALKNAAPDDWQDRYNTETKITHRIEQVSDSELLAIINQHRTIEHDPQPMLQHSDEREHVASADNDASAGGTGDASAPEVPEGEKSRA
jgi:hypothetical protein